MLTELLKIKGDWTEVLNDCRSTVGKDPLRNVKTKFKREILIAEHSPIRDISVKWKWWDIKSWVATHWSRHKWECFIQTQRTDRTGVDRDKLPQDAPVTFTGEANVQNLIDTMRKRLCFMAAPETREYAEDLKYTITMVEPEIGHVLVPNCVYRCGCPEMNGGCGWYDRMVEKYPNLDSRNIQERYDAYDEIWRQRERKVGVDDATD